MKPVANSAAIAEVFGRLRSEAARAAFWRIVSDDALRRTHDLRAVAGGPKKALHFWRGEANELAFIANDNDLLWYFRPPFLRQNNVDIGWLNANVGETGQPQPEHISVRVQTFEQADALCDYLRDRAH